MSISLLKHLVVIPTLGKLVISYERMLIKAWEVFLVLMMFVCTMAFSLFVLYSPFADVEKQDTTLTSFPGALKAIFNTVFPTTPHEVTDIVLPGYTLSYVIAQIVFYLSHTFLVLLLSAFLSIAASAKDNLNDVEWLYAKSCAQLRYISTHNVEQRSDSSRVNDTILSRFIEMEESALPIASLTFGSRQFHSISSEVKMSNDIKNRNLPKIITRIRSLQKEAQTFDRDASTFGKSGFLHKLTNLLYLGSSHHNSFILSKLHKELGSSFELPNLEPLILSLGINEEHGKALFTLKYYTIKCNLQYLLLTSFNPFTDALKLSHTLQSLISSPSLSHNYFAEEYTKLHKQIKAFYVSLLDACSNLQEAKTLLLYEEEEGKSNLELACDQEEIELLTHPYTQIFLQNKWNHTPTTQRTGFFRKLERFINLAPYKIFITESIIEAASYILIFLHVLTGNSFFAFPIPAYTLYFSWKLCRKRFHEKENFYKSKWNILDTVMEFILFSTIFISIFTKTKYARVVYATITIIFMFKTLAYKFLLHKHMGPLVKSLYDSSGIFIIFVASSTFLILAFLQPLYLLFSQYHHHQNETPSLTSITGIIQLLAWSIPHQSSSTVDVMHPTRAFPQFVGVFMYISHQFISTLISSIFLGDVISLYKESGYSELTIWKFVRTHVWNDYIYKEQIAVLALKEVTHIGTVGRKERNFQEYNDVLYKTIRSSTAKCRVNI